MQFSKTTVGTYAVANFVILVWDKLHGGESPRKKYYNAFMT